MPCGIKNARSPPSRFREKLQLDSRHDDHTIQAGDVPVNSVTTCLNLSGGVIRAYDGVAGAHRFHTPQVTIRVFAVQIVKYLSFPCQPLAGRLEFADQVGALVPQRPRALDDETQPAVDDAPAQRPLIAQSDQFSLPMNSCRRSYPEAPAWPLMRRVISVAGVNMRRDDPLCRGPGLGMHAQASPYDSIFATNPARRMADC